MLRLALRVLRPVIRANRALARTWRGRFIIVFVVAQLLLPLRYYIDHRDPHDERFAWRMFSPMRMTACVPKFKLDGKPFDLRSEFHEAWIELASRGRFTVIEAMGRRVCERHPGSVVDVSLDCTELGARTTSWGGYDMCQVPEL